MTSPDVEVGGDCEDGAGAVEAVMRLAPDSLFLDVQMPGLDGFEVVEALGPEAFPAVVFVTAYDKYALEAFEVHAIDYLLKPFERGRVRETLRHCRTLAAGEGELGRRLRALVENLGTSRKVKRLMVRKEAACTSCARRRSTGSKPPATT